MRRPAGRPRHAERGMTLIEITVALLVVTLLFSAVTMGIGALVGAKAKESAGELAGTIRSLYDTAALTGKTCRLVFELPGVDDEVTPVRYRAECAGKGITTSRDREELLEEEDKRRAESAKRPKRRDERVFAAETEGPSIDDLMAEEEQRVEQQTRFSEFTSEAVEPRELPSQVRLSVWTRQQRDYVDQGVAYLYFFPQGFTERAQLVLSQGNNAWTLQVSPLTGKVTVTGEALEVPQS